MQQNRETLGNLLPLSRFVAPAFFEGDLVVVDASLCPNGMPKKYAVTFELVRGGNHATVRLSIEKLLVCGVSAYAEWHTGVEGRHHAKLSAFTDEMPDPGLRYRLMPQEGGGE